MIFVARFVLMISMLGLYDLSFCQTKPGLPDLDGPSIYRATTHNLTLKINNKLSHKKSNSVGEAISFRTQADDAMLPLKDSPLKEIILPGLLRSPGVGAQLIDPSRGQIVEFANGGSTSVYASGNDINLIQLPFLHPLITSTDDIDIKQSGANIYFQFKNGAVRPVQLFVENTNHSSTVLSLQLIPKLIVSQVIRVVDNSGISSGLVRQNKSTDYVSQTVTIMEIVANNQNPQGFTKISLSNIPSIVFNGLVVTPLSRMSNINQDIYVYEVRNPGVNIARLSEKEFDGETVTSISIYPTPVLAQGERTKVIVIARKQPSLASKL